MLAILAAIIIFFNKCVSVLEDGNDFSWFWLAVALFVLHFGWEVWPWTGGGWRSGRGDRQS